MNGEPEGVRDELPHPFGGLPQPVTGGVKTLVTPTRLVLQALLAIGVKIRTPAFFIFSVCVIRPLLFEAPVRMFTLGPLILTWIPWTTLPPWVRWIFRVVLRPTNSCFGVTLLTATHGTGGVMTPTVWTVALAVLFAVFVSGRLPTTLTVFTWAPTVLGVVTRVIVTDAPAAIVPMVQLRIAPPVQVPCVVVAETKVFPAGIGSATTTPVAVLGPLFVTTIVQVMFPSPRVCVAGEPLFVTERSTRAWTQAVALDSPEPSLVVVTW